MDPFLGTIRVFPYGFAPRGWLECAGQVMQIVQNQALYSLIGTRFGGDGRTTFYLPDMREAEPDLSGNDTPGTRGLCRYYIATMGIYPSRD